MSSLPSIFTLIQDTLHQFICVIQYIQTCSAHFLSGCILIYIYKMTVDIFNKKRSIFFYLSGISKRQIFLLFFLTAFKISLTLKTLTSWCLLQDLPFTPYLLEMWLQRWSPQLYRLWSEPYSLITFSDLFIYCSAESSFCLGVFLPKEKNSSSKRNNFYNFM